MNNSKKYGKIIIEMIETNHLRYGQISKILGISYNNVVQIYKFECKALRRKCKYKKIHKMGDHSEKKKNLIKKQKEVVTKRLLRRQNELDIKNKKEREEIKRRDRLRLSPEEIEQTKLNQVNEYHEKYHRFPRVKFWCKHDLIRMKIVARETTYINLNKANGLAAEIEWMLDMAEINDHID